MLKDDRLIVYLLNTFSSGNSFVHAGRKIYDCLSTAPTGTLVSHVQLADHTYILCVWVVHVRSQNVHVVSTIIYTDKVSRIPCSGQDAAFTEGESITYEYNCQEAERATLCYYIEDGTMSYPEMKLKRFLSDAPSCASSHVLHGFWEVLDSDSRLL